MKKCILEYNRKSENIRERRNHVISSKRLAFGEIDEEVGTINVNLGLIIIGNSLTEQARDEFNVLKSLIKYPITIYDNVKIEFRMNLIIIITDIIEMKWREENRGWGNIDGKKQDWIELRAENNKY